MYFLKMTKNETFHPQVIFKEMNTAKKRDVESLYKQVFFPLERFEFRGFETKTISLNLIMFLPSTYSISNVSFSQPFLLTK